MWLAIVEQVDQPGSESEFFSVEDVDRSTLATHPWSLQGGGATQLQARLEGSRVKLSSLVSSLGITSFTLEDDLYMQPRGTLHRLGVPQQQIRPLVEGDVIRDWSLQPVTEVIFPYSAGIEPVGPEPDAYKVMWIGRTNLSNNKMFGGLTKVETGLKWWEYGRLTAAKLRVPLSITFAFVATHNHFGIDEGGKVFNRSAPVIKLPDGATEDEHLSLLGLLNSATACFWLKQVCHNKGGGGVNEGHRGDAWEFFYEFTGTKLAEYPLPADRPRALAAKLHKLILERAALLEDVAALLDGGPAALESAGDRDAELLARAISLQEEADWQVMGSYGLLPEGFSSLGELAPPLSLGERAFEIVLARRIAAGDVESTWFARHGSTPVTDVSEHWPADYRAVVEQRIAIIESDRDIGLIERPECKRRWSQTSWADREHAALEGLVARPPRSAAALAAA